MDTYFLLDPGITFFPSVLPRSNSAASKSVEVEFGSQFPPFSTNALELQPQAHDSQGEIVSL